MDFKIDYLVLHCTVDDDDCNNVSFKREYRVTVIKCMNTVVLYKKTINNNGKVLFKILSFYLIDIE